MRASFRVIALIAGLAIVPLAAAGVIADAEVSQPGVWLAWGGATRLHFNPDALVRFGIRIAGTPGASARIEGVPGRNYEVETYPTEEAGALTVHPRPLHGGTWHAYADHRMATAGALLGLVVDGVEVDDIGATSKTLPDFGGMWSAVVGA